MPRYRFKLNRIDLLALFTVISVLAHGCAQQAFGRVIMYDAVALPQQRVFLKATTVGRFFRAGGEVVAFWVEGEFLGKSLSGFDGVAFKLFTPEKAGLFQLRAKSNGDEDTGILLSVKAGETLLIVDVWSSLLENLITQTPKSGSQQALEKISKIHPILYLQTGLVGVHRFKTWLRTHNFPLFPVLPWANGDIFREMTEKKVAVYAVIGSTEVIATAGEENRVLLSFDPKAGVDTVTNWSEVRKIIIQKAGHKNPDPLDPHQP